MSAKDVPRSADSPSNVASFGGSSPGKFNFNLRNSGGGENDTHAGMANASTTIRANKNPAPFGNTVSRGNSVASALKTTFPGNSSGESHSIPTTATPSGEFMPSSRNLTVATAPSYKEKDKMREGHHSDSKITGAVASGLAQSNNSPAPPRDSAQGNDRQWVVSQGSFRSNRSAPEVPPEDKDSRRIHQSPTSLPHDNKPPARETPSTKYSRKEDEENRRADNNTSFIDELAPTSAPASNPAAAGTASQTDYIQTKGTQGCMPHSPSNGTSGPGNRISGPPLPPLGRGGVRRPPCDSHSNNKNHSSPLLSSNMSYSYDERRLQRGRGSRYRGGLGNGQHLAYHSSQQHQSNRRPLLDNNCVGQAGAAGPGLKQSNYIYTGGGYVPSSVNTRRPQQILGRPGPQRYIRNDGAATFHGRKWGPTESNEGGETVDEKSGARVVAQSTLTSQTPVAGEYESCKQVTPHSYCEPAAPAAGACNDAVDGGRGDGNAYFGGSNGSGRDDNVTANERFFPRTRHQQQPQLQQTQVLTDFTMLESCSAIAGRPPGHLNSAPGGAMHHALFSASSTGEPVVIGKEDVAEGGLSSTSGGIPEETASGGCLGKVSMSTSGTGRPVTARQQYINNGLAGGALHNNNHNRWNRGRGYNDKMYSDRGSLTTRHYTSSFHSRPGPHNAPAYMNGGFGGTAGVPSSQSSYHRRNKFYTSSSISASGGYGGGLVSRNDGSGVAGGPGFRGRGSGRNFMRTSTVAMGDISPGSGRHMRVEQKPLLLNDYRDSTSGVHLSHLNHPLDVIGRGQIPAEASSGGISRLPQFPLCESPPRTTLYYIPVTAPTIAAQDAIGTNCKNIIFDEKNQLTDRKSSASMKPGSQVVAENLVDGPRETPRCPSSGVPLRLVRMFNSVSAEELQQAAAAQIYHD